MLAPQHFDTKVNVPSLFANEYWYLILTAKENNAQKLG